MGYAGVGGGRPSPARSADARCPEWLGWTWVVVADRRANAVTGRDYWAWRLDAVDREAVLRARDAGTATTVNRKEGGEWKLKAIRLR